jgi:hypothetical protein
MEASGKQLTFAMYGDTAVEALRGTFLGNAWTNFEEGPISWSYFFSHYAAASFGVAGTNPAANLLLRHVHGC